MKDLRKSPISNGNPEFDRQEEKRLREREEEGLEPERRTGPRQNEGISSEGGLRAHPDDEDTRRREEKGTVDRDAVHILGDHPRGSHAPSE